MNEFPENKRFAFAIHDDTDLSTIENVGPIYRLLAELGMRTTKSVWPLGSVPDGWHAGASLQDPDYLSFILNFVTRASRSLCTESEITMQPAKLSSGVSMSSIV